jgi:hypothetical protein
MIRLCNAEVTALFWFDIGQTNCGRESGPSEQLASGRNAYCRRPVERLAVRVERRPVHHGIACAAVPAGVSAAVAAAGDMPDEDLIRPEDVPVGASRRWVGDPLPGRGLHQLAEHSQKVNLAPARQWGRRHIATGPTYR